MIEYGNFEMKEEPLLGEKPRSERMFYYVRMEEMVPENHLLRLINKHIDFGFIRDKVKPLYSHTGRPSIDPEVLLRILLVGYLYGITSERRLCEEVQSNSLVPILPAGHRDISLSCYRAQLEPLPYLQ